MNKDDDYNVLNVLKNLPNVMLFFLIFSACVGTGVAIIYAFKYDIFLKIDTLKLLLFAVSISLPIFLVNAVIYSFKFEFTGEKDDLVKTKLKHNLYMRDIFADSSVVTIIQLNLLILVFWYFKKSFILFVAVQFIWYLVYFIFIFIKYKLCYSKINR